MRTAAGDVGQAGRFDLSRALKFAQANALPDEAALERFRLPCPTIRREGISGKANANRTHREVGAKVLQTLQELGGTMPEDLPTAENLKRIAARCKKGTSARLMRHSSHEVEAMD